MFNKSSLQQYQNTISQHIINKMAKAGITKSILQQTFQKSGREGIRILLGENINGKARITTNKNILQKISDLLENK